VNVLAYSLGTCAELIRRAKRKRAHRWLAPIY
jgi:hypothetical protein